MSPETQDQAAGETIHERQRSAIVGGIPRWYSPAVHFMAPAALGLAVLIGGIVGVHDLRAIELVTVPIALFLAFGLEWRTHQIVLHRRLPLLGLLYDRHELMHHVVFTYDDLAMRSRRELWLILMPAYACVLIFLLDAPLAFAIGKLFTPNVGYLFLVTSMSFFLSYEWLHAAYHLPPESFIGRLRPIAILREHHRRHHDPRLMKRWNFNVTVPVFDWIHRTVWSPEREAEREAKRAVRGVPASRRARQA